MFIMELINPETTKSYWKTESAVCPSHVTADTKAILPKSLLHQEDLFAGWGLLA